MLRVDVSNNDLNVKRNTKQQQQHFFFKSYRHVPPPPAAAIESIDKGTEVSSTSA